MTFQEELAMAELHVIGALREKRSELGGVMKQLEQRLEQNRTALAHLDATIRLFDPDTCRRRSATGHSEPAAPGFVPVNACG